MILRSPFTSEGEYLPEAYNGCSCDCHYIAGVMHCVPCCGPGRMTLEELDRMAEEEQRKRVLIEAEDKCKCGNISPGLNVCPYDAEINGATEPTCNCCDDCAEQCGNNI